LEIEKDAEIVNDEEEAEEDLGLNFKIIFENNKDQKTEGKTDIKVS